MRNITIQKIAVNKFEVNVVCSYCGRNIQYIFDDLSTHFPYNLKEIIVRVNSLKCKCSCGHQICSTINTQVILIEAENVEYMIEYSSFHSTGDLHIQNSLFDAHIDLSIDNDPVELIRYQKRKRARGTNNASYSPFIKICYKIKNTYTNYVIKGWVESFKTVHQYINAYSNSKKSKQTDKSAVKYDSEISNNASIKKPISSNSSKNQPKLNKSNNITKKHPKTHNLNAKSVLIISDLRRCTNKEHTIRDVQAQIRTRYKGQILTEIIPASFCRKCITYSISESDFATLKGKPLCKVKWRSRKHEKYYKKGFRDFNTTHSILYNLGYNVQKNRNLTTEMRRQILVNAICTHLLSRGEVCSYLESFINQKKNQSQMHEAVAKWRSDLQYIKSIDFKTYQKIEVKSIIKK